MVKILTIVNLKIHLLDKISQILTIIKASPFHGNLRLCGGDRFGVGLNLKKFCSCILIVLLQLLELAEGLLQLGYFLLLLNGMYESLGVSLGELLVLAVKVLGLGKG
jgi:hypothetical protein